MNWDMQLILRAIVPVSFVAIWALTALFNKEQPGSPPRQPRPMPGGGPRPGDPTLRWGPQASRPAVTTTRRIAGGEDDILIIPNDPARPTRIAPPRQATGVANRRASKSRQPAPPPDRKAEGVAARPRLEGVSQIVNQSLARPITLTPLTTIAPMATATGSDLANAPSAPSKTSIVVTASTLLPLMTDPIRLRESFIVNELFQPPVALRGRRGHRR